jgi:hypothetical protein
VEPDLKDVYFSVMAGHHPVSGTGQAGRRAESPVAEAVP